MPVDQRLFALLTEKLPAGWRALSWPTQGETFAQAILSAYQLQATPSVGDVDLGPQIGRVHVATLTRGNDASVIVANVHLEWGQPSDGLMGLGHLPGAKVIAGDFNRPPGSAAVSGARYLIPDGPTSFKHSGGRAEMNAVDGFIIVPAELAPAPMFLSHSLGFDRDLSDLLRALDKAGPWTWHIAESTWHGEYLNVRPMSGLRVQIHGAAGNYALSAEIDPECSMTRDAIDTIIQQLLRDIASS